MLIRYQLDITPLLVGPRLIYWILLPLIWLSGLSKGDPSANFNGNNNNRHTGYACEGTSLTLSCDDPFYIHIIRANFGRFSISTCNNQGNLEWSVNCKSPESLYKIQTLCNRKNKCLLSASSSLFGDPCPGTLKYLEVHYECVPKNPRSGGTGGFPSSEAHSPPSTDFSPLSPSSSIPSPSSPFDDPWSSPSQSSPSQPSSPSSPFNEQSLSNNNINNKPKNQSPPPIIIPTINPRPSISQTPSSYPSKVGLPVSPPSLSLPPPHQPGLSTDFGYSTEPNLDTFDREIDSYSVAENSSSFMAPSTAPSTGQFIYGNQESEGTIRILLILGSTLNSIILLIALVTLVLVRSLQTKESALIRKNVTINLLFDHLVLLLILGTYLSPNYFSTTSLTSVSLTSKVFNNISTLRSLGFLVALYHYFLLVHFVWILFDLDLELHFRLSRKQFDDPSMVLGPSVPVATTVNPNSAGTTVSILTGGINPVKLRRYLYLTSYLIPLVVILLISWSTSSQALPMFANLCSLEARSHLASFVIASSIILTGLGLVLLLVTYSRIGLQNTSGDSTVSPGSIGGFTYPPGLITSADKCAFDLMLNRKLKISLFLRFSLNLLAAINCTLGVVYLTYRVSTIGLLFAFTNVSLGLFVFSYYCLTKENIRARYSLIFSYVTRHLFCLKRNSKTDYMDNHPHGHHHPHLDPHHQHLSHPHHHHTLGHPHPNVVHHLPLNSGLNGGLSTSIVVGAYNKNLSVQNLTGNPAQLTSPIISNSSSIGGLSKHYLASGYANTESGSDYGCRRLTSAATAVATTPSAVGPGPHMGTHGPTPNHFYHLYNPKQSCNSYACHHMIEHVYECIDDEPYVTKVILPANMSRTISARVLVFDHQVPEQC